MKQTYHHLTEQQRILLSMMIQKGYSKSKIANNLGVHRSTVYRELKRNSWKFRTNGTSCYTPMHVQNRYQTRRHRLSKLYAAPALRKNIEEKLLNGWSPWQIEGRLKRENGGKSVVSH